jgi:uncharacterized membrane protein
MLGMPRDERAPPAQARDQARAAAAPEGPPPARPTGTDPVAWVIALATFLAYGTISVFKYLRLDPGSWDLGIFTEYVKQVAHLHAPVVAIRGTGFNLLGDHFQPIVGLIAPFFRLFPTPVTLLAAQALLTAISVIPVCRAGRDLLGTWPSRGIGAAYGFSWGLQQMVSFDFHEIAFAVPLLAFALSALVRRRLRPAVAWALPLVLVKEDQGLTVAAIGLVLAGIGLARMRRDRRAPAEGRPDPAESAAPGAWVRAGALLAAWGLAWSAVAIWVVIPHFNPAHTYPYWNDGGVIGPGGHLSLPAVAHQLAQGGTEKLWTTYLILLPVAFLALRSPVALIAVPSLVLRFLSINSYFWGDGWHYNATVMPAVFLAAVDGMAALRASSARRAARGGRRALPAAGAAVARYGAAVMVAIAGWLAFRFPLAGLWQPQTYQITSHVRAEDAAMARVPAGTTVEATLSMLAPLAARDDTYWIGTSPNPAPRYVVFDADNSGWSPPPANALRFVEQRHPGSGYQRIFARDNVFVFRRAGPTGG